MQPKHKPGTTLEQIVTDNWSRNLRIEQTIEEAEAMGFMVEHEDISAWYDKLTKEMELWYNR